VASFPDVMAQRRTISISHASGIDDRSAVATRYSKALASNPAKSP
jgi:hypothetical protein